MSSTLTINKPLKYIIDKVSSNLTYEGWSLPGTATSSALWQIKRTTKIGSQTTDDFANNGEFNQIWDNRESLFPPVSFSNVYSTLFDGINDYVNFGDTFNFDIANQFSISGWFWQDNQSSRMNLFSKVTSDGNVYGFSLAIETSGYFFLQARAPGYLRSHTGTTLNVPVQGWNHFVLTYNGSSNIDGFRLYLNNAVGDVPSSGSLGASWLSSQNFIIGNRNTAFPFSGYMDSWTVWSKALSVAEIDAIYTDDTDQDQLSFAGDLVSWYEFGDGDVLGTIYDNNGSNNGVMQNFSSTVTDVFKEFTR